MMCGFVQLDEKLKVQRMCIRFSLPNSNSAAVAIIPHVIMSTH